MSQGNQAKKVLKLSEADRKTLLVYSNEPTEKVSKSFSESSLINAIHKFKQ